jgi:hypothetical protein
MPVFIPEADLKAQIKVTLQLLDFDTVNVREEMAVGALGPAQDIDLPQPVDVPSIDPKWPTEEIMIDAEVAAEQESSNLERPIDPVGFQETQEVPAMKGKANKPTKEKRWHPPHNRPRKWPPLGS